MNFVLALAAVGVSGFISLSYEIVWFRAYSFASGTLPVVFGLLLFFYLLGLAAGSFVSRDFCRDRSATGDPRQLRALAAFIFLANAVGFLVVPGLAHLATVIRWTAALPLVALAAGLWGATLPLISHFGIAPNDRAGQRLSYVYLANILGSVAGTLLTGFVLMDVWPMRSLALFLALLGLALASCLLLAGRVRGHELALALTAISATAAACVVITPAAFDQLYERLQFKKEFTSDLRFADVVESRSGVVAVTRDSMVFGGGAYDGMISTSLVNDRNMIVRAYGVGAIHPAPREVLMIGLATGAWAQVIANMPGVEKVTIVEINPGYLRLIAKYPQVSSLLRNPKVEIVIDDGRRWLARHLDRQFDVIVANLTFHFRAHATNVLSAEFLRLVRAHLRPGGVYYFNTTFSDDALKTALTVFPYGLRFINFATVSDSPIRINEDRWREMLQTYRIDGRPVFDLSRERDRARLESVLALTRTIQRRPVVYGLESRESVLARLSQAHLVTDDNMWTEWRAHPPAPLSQ
jgi:spermidine synthase